MLNPKGVSNVEKNLVHQTHANRRDAGLFARRQSGRLRLCAREKEGKKLVLRDVVERQNENLVRPRAGFEFVQASKTSVKVRAVATKKEVGTLNCTVCPGGDCITRIHPNGSNSCVGCDGKNNCLISPF